VRTVGDNFQAVLVDMEEGVVSEVMKSPLRDVFDHRQLITDVSGSGNNWQVFPFHYCWIHSDSLFFYTEVIGEQFSYVTAYCGQWLSNDLRRSYSGPMRLNLRHCCNCINTLLF